VIDWLVTNALIALALAALAGLFIWTFRPAPAVRHALWLVVVLKLIAPGGPTVALPIAPPAATVQAKPAAATPSPEVVVEEERFEVWVENKPGQDPEEAVGMALRQQNHEEATEAPAATPQAAVEAPAAPFDYRPWLLGLWVVGAAAVGWRQVCETVRFARFARNAKLAPASLVAEVAAVAVRLGVRAPAVRTLAGLTSPVLWCLGRPVLLWPAGLECRLKGDGRRAVIAHELAHLRRRDHWARRLEMVAAVLHWWNPLFWVARQKLRADAELACDAWAAGQADRRAYAEALLEVCSFNPRRRPAPAVGVFGEGRRAMQERLTMIMRDRVPCRLAFGAKLVVALMAFAAVPAWTLGQQGKPEQNDDREVFLVEVADKAEADDTQTKEIENQIRALAEKLAALKAAKSQKQAADAQKQAAEHAKQVQEHVLRLSRDGQFMALPQGGGPKVLVAGQDGVKVIGPDGKEIKDVQVIIGGRPGADTVVKPVQRTTNAAEIYKYAMRFTEDGKAHPVPVHPEWVAEARVGQGGQGGTTITLSRATYKLSKEQAAALGTLLGSVKATVMETKVDGDAITVTTTPDVQQAIGQIVRLIHGGGENVPFRVRLIQPQGGVAPPTPPTPPTPAVPPPSPAKPGAPAKPANPEKINVNVILDQLKAAGANPDQVDVRAMVEKALKDAGVDKGNLDMAKLHELLRSVKPAEKPVELRVEVETDGAKPKAKVEKK
jgi:beta-lactamase regulating signal transducer with metallopeptidase domain